MFFPESPFGGWLERESEGTQAEEVRFCICEMISKTLCRFPLFETPKYVDPSWVFQRAPPPTLGCTWGLWRLQFMGDLPRPAGRQHLTIAYLRKL